MGEFENAFLNTFRVTGIFGEWMQHIRAKRNASIFANFILECLRDPVNGERRLQFSAFSTFISARTWPEVLPIISEHVSERDRDLLKGAHASKFYLQLQTMVCLQIQDYWQQFLKQQEGKPEFEVPVMMMTRGDIMKTIKENFEKATKDIIKQIRREIEGEDWKNGPSPE